MSVNFSKKLHLKPSELYLLIQQDQLLCRYCDFLEKTWPHVASHKPKRIRAILTVYTSLFSGSTRNSMIKYVRKLGYKKSYAEKLVDKTIGRFRELFKKSEAVFIKEEPDAPTKGRWGKPGSREATLGRPPKKLRLQKIPKAKPNKKIVELTYLFMLLSGSFIRYAKLIMRMLCKEPEITKIIVETLGNILPIPVDKLGESFNKMIQVGGNFEEQIDEWYSQIMESVWKDTTRILEAQAQ